MLILALAAVIAGGRDYADAVGQGAESCATWSSNRANATIARKLDREWLFGFLSGANYLLAKDGEHKLLWPSDDGRDYVAYVDSYCRQRPADQVQLGAAALVRKLKRDGGL